MYKIYKLATFPAFLAMALITAALMGFAIPQANPPTGQKNAPIPQATPGLPLHNRIQETPIPGSFQPCGGLSGSRAYNCVVNDIIVQENQLVKTLEKYSPIMEVYIQDMRPNPELGAVPVNDHYFLGRVKFRRNRTITVQSLLPMPGFGKSFLRHFSGPIGGYFSPRYRPSDFYFALLMDTRRFNRRFYKFTFVRSQYLGDVRCLVFDVTPEPHIYRGMLFLRWEDVGLFEGRIWVEDRGYHIVRSDGTFTPSPPGSTYFHFDSWRENVRPGLWLPAYSYSQESNVKYGLDRTMRFRAEIHFWGYGLKNPNRQSEMTQIEVGSPSKVRDTAGAADALSPVQSERAWEEQAQDNVLDRLQKAGLLAPPGQVGKVLDTVVNNLIVSNHLNNLPPIHCRVLLTSTLDSFDVGNTIVLSRGLIDVLPDEPSLAAMLAPELARIVLQQDDGMNATQWAFADRLMVPDAALFRILSFRPTERQEGAADAEALKLLQNSPYKNQLGKAGLFLREMARIAPHTPRLFGAQLGARLANKNHVLRMAALMINAPQLKPRNVDQIAALPLGARIELSPWNDAVTLMKAKPVALRSAREKMPFEVTPLFPYLTRYPTEQARR